MRPLLTMLILSLGEVGLSLDNGLALTPPMGWMTWERFRCNVDCENDPNNCLSEDLIRAQAEQMRDRGFLDAGYEYIIIDDCWLSHERDDEGRLQPDPDRFPSGIPALADYVHSLGLKFGIYEDYGNFTCAGYPGILGHLETDAQTFAEWGVDYIKVDGCYADLDDMEEGYPLFGQYLNASGRPIVYSCSWPAYWTGANQLPDYAAIAENCNLWRNYGDIQDDWDDVLSIIDYYGDHQDEFAQYAGPGRWNDPDMLIIGNFALSREQARVQMAIWAVLASPLIMSNDLRDIDDTSVEILQNFNVIKVNQDPIGHQGRRVYHNVINKLDVFVKNVNPTSGSFTSAVAAIMYRGTDGTPVRVTFTPLQLGLTYPSGYILSEVFNDEPRGEVTLDQDIEVVVNPNGVELLRFDVNPPSSSRPWRLLKRKKGAKTANDIDAADRGQGEDEDSHGGSILVEKVGESGWHKVV